MNNSELVKTKIARANSNKHSEDWGLQFWEEHLETEEAKKLIWNHSPQQQNSMASNLANIGRHGTTFGEDKTADTYIKTTQATKQQIEQMFGGKA